MIMPIASIAPLAVVSLMPSELTIVNRVALFTVGREINNRIDRVHPSIMRSAS